MGIVPGAPRSRVGDGVPDRRQGDKADLTTRRLSANLARELEAVHDRHAQVAQHEIGTAVRDEAFHSVLAVHRDRDARAKRGEHVPGEVTMVSVILDDEYGDTAQRHGQPHWCWEGCVTLRVRAEGSAPPCQEQDGKTLSLREPATVQEAFTSGREDRAIRLSAARTPTPRSRGYGRGTCPGRGCHRCAGTGSRTPSRSLSPAGRRSCMACRCTDHPTCGRGCAPGSLPLSITARAFSREGTRKARVPRSGCGRAAWDGPPSVNSQRDAMARY